MKNTAALWMALMTAGTILVGCTEDRQQKSVLKYEVYEKSASAFADPNVEYLYAPSSVTAGRQSSYARAYWLGDERIVTMQFDETHLNVYSIDKEKKFSDNPSNKRLVMKIPVEHLDYRCADDAYGECTSEEIENNRIPWNEKKFFRAHFEESKIVDPSFLPSGGLDNECYSQKESKLVTQKVDAVSINFRIERAYQNQLYFYCIRGLDNLENLNWTDVTQYSFVRLDSVTSPGYKKAVYNPEWINTFGFFEKDDYQLDVDGNSTQEGEIKYISRWNPERKDVPYYLSSEFNKPENAIIKAATYESIKRLNQGLAKAGVKFRISLHEPDASVDPVDIRTNMIILAEDPFEASVIGYGPTIVNPRSGEIISGRTVMYNGSLKRFIRYTYDEILLGDKKAKKSAAQAALAANNTAATPAPGSTHFEAQRIPNFVSMAPELSQMVKMNPILDLPMVKQIDRTPKVTEADMEKAAAYSANQDLIAQLSEQGFYPAELLEFGDVSQDIVEDLVKNIGQLQPWENLSEVQRQSVIDTLVPYVWVPTLVHEMGHNLGLRHNFSGSEDKDNFYTNDELKAMAVPVSSKNVPYASIMDYPKSEINALRTLGKYDIAALRFGYNMEVQTATGEIVKVDSAVPFTGELKAFDYCSDEGVALNPNCNPFDEGSGYLAITESMIESYNDRYNRSNFRRGRANFSSMDDDLYFSGVYRTFNKQRLLLELYQDIMIDFNLDQATIDGVEWLKDLDQAVEKAGDFLMAVIAEPETQCALQVPTGQIQIIPLSFLAELTKNPAKTCAEFSASLNTGYTIVAEAGKPLNNYKLRSNPNRYADQIDVRGVWIDKAAATRALFRRTLGNTIKDKNTGNFMDHPRVAAKLETFLHNLINDKMSADVEFITTEGDAIPFNLSYSLTDKAYEVRAPEMPVVNYVLGLKYVNMNLSEALTVIMLKGVLQGADSATRQDLLQKLDVKSVQANTSESCTSEMCILDIRGDMLLTKKSNEITFAVMQNINKARKYEKVSAEQLTAIQGLLTAGTPAPGTLTADELAIYNGGLDDLNKFLNGEITASRFLETTLLDIASTLGV